MFVIKVVSYITFAEKFVRLHIRGATNKKYIFY